MPALFEVGQIFKGDRPEDQFIAAAGLRRGLSRSRPAPAVIWYGGSSQDADAFDAKADALAVLAAAGAPMQALQIVPGGPAWFHPGRSGTIQIGPAERARPFRRIASARAGGARRPTARSWRFEVILDRIPEPKAKPTRAKPVLELSPFQPVTRDFAFVVDSDVKAADIVRAAQNVDKKLITARDDVRRL